MTGAYDQGAGFRGQNQWRLRSAIFVSMKRIGIESSAASCHVKGVRYPEDQAVPWDTADVFRSGGRPLDKVDEIRVWI